MIATVLRRRAALAALFAGATLLAAPALPATGPPRRRAPKTFRRSSTGSCLPPPAGGSPLVAVKAGRSALRRIGGPRRDERPLQGRRARTWPTIPRPSSSISSSRTTASGASSRTPFRPCVSHANDMTSVTKIDNYHQTTVIDPALAWFVSCAASADKGSVDVTGPKLNQTFDFGPLKADCATTVNADGSVSSTAKEDIRDIAFKVSGTDKDGQAGRRQRPNRRHGFQHRRRRTEVEKAFRPRRPHLRPSRRSRGARGGTERRAEASGGAGPAFCRRRRSLEGDDRLADRRGRARRRQVRLRRGERRPRQRDRHDDQRRRAQPPRRPRPAKRDRADPLEDRPCPYRQGDRHRRGRRPGDRQPASRRPRAGDLRSQFGQGFGGFARGRAAEDRDRALACGRAGDRRRYPGRNALRRRQAVGRRDGPDAQLRQDDERDPGAGAGGGRQGAARGRHGQGSRQDRTRRGAELADRGRLGPFDQGQRHSARQGAGVRRDSERIVPGALIRPYEPPSAAGKRRLGRPLWSLRRFQVSDGDPRTLFLSSKKCVSARRHPAQSPALSRGRDTAPSGFPPRTALIGSKL